MQRPQRTGSRSEGESPYLMMHGVRMVSTTVTPHLMSLSTKTLSETEVITINERFGLDLDYHQATHYRAAQVIWSLSRNVPFSERDDAIDRGREDPADRDTQASNPDPEGNS